MRAMLCLVADNEDQEKTADPIGKIVARRLRTAQQARGWTQGQVHYQANAGLPDGHEAVSLTTVQMLLRGAHTNPSLGTVLAVARALDLTLDQVVGISPMPESVSVPPEDDVDSRLRRIEDALAKIGAFHAAEAEADEQTAIALEQEAHAARRVLAPVSQIRPRPRKAK